jgi:hypothetical protein
MGRLLRRLLGLGNEPSSYYEVEAEPSVMESQPERSGIERLREFHDKATAWDAESTGVGRDATEFSKPVEAVSMRVQEDTPSNFDEQGRRKLIQLSSDTGTVKGTDAKGEDIAMDYKLRLTLTVDPSATESDIKALSKQTFRLKHDTETYLTVVRKVLDGDRNKTLTSPAHPWVRYGVGDVSLESPATLIFEDGRSIEPGDTKFGITNDASAAVGKIYFKFIDTDW